MLPIGIEIGSSSIKAVELLRQKDVFLLSSYAQIPSPNEGISSDNETNLELTAEVLKKTWGELKTRNRIIALSVDQSLVFTRVLEMPEMTEMELASSINWEAEEYIPLPLPQVRLEWQVMNRKVGDNGEKRMDVLLIAVPRALVNKYHKIAELARLELKILEPESISIMRALKLFKIDNNYNVVVNFGDKKTDILVNSAGTISFVRSIPSGGRSLTRAISAGLHLTEEQAENYKIAYGFDKTKLDGALYNVMMPVFDVIIQEIKRAVIFQQNKDLNKPLNMLVICGAGSNLPDINVVLSNAYEMEIFTADPFSIIKPAAVNVKIGSTANQKFLVPVGLSMNEI